MSKPTPILPAVSVTRGQTAAARAQALSAPARNISDRTQRYSPSAYSLITRQAGSNSGLRTCKLASRSSSAVAAPIATRAADVARSGVVRSEKTVSTEVLLASVGQCVGRCRVGSVQSVLTGVDLDTWSVSAGLVG